MKNINIREALLELDKRTSCQYDLTTLYEACKLDDNDKNQLVKYIDAYDHPSVIGGFLASKCEALSEELGDDDVSDLKVIDDINCGEDHTLWSLADKLEDDALELKELTEDIEPDEKATVAGRIREAATGVLVGKLGYEEDFVDNYMTIDVDDTDENTHIKVEVRAEVDYDELMTLGQALDPIVREYDKNAYFEPVTSGIMSAYIRKDQSDDIPDEAAVKEWTERFNACQTKDDVINVYKDLIKVRDNNEVTFGTIEAIYDVIDAKMSSLGEALTEALFTVPADYEDYCPYCATRALKGVGDGRAVCDSCGAEYEVIALGNNRVRLEPLFLSESVTYPNGVECRNDSVDMDKALDYQYGTDRDPDNSHYTEQEKQKALNYWIDKYEPRPDGKSYITESTLITPVRNGYHNLWKISDNLLVHDDGGVYHVVQKDGWKNTYIFNSADIEEVNDFLMAHYDVALARANPTEMKDKKEAFDVDKVQKRIARVNEFDNGYVIHNDYFKATSDEAEEMAKQQSIENPDEIFYVKYDNIMEPCSDIKWKNGQQLTETVDDNVQYGVHSFSQDAIIFRGTEEECGKYIDQHKELWDDAEVYRMTPDDPHYKKEEKLTLSESDDTDILYNTEDPDDYDGIEAGHQFIEDSHEWTLFKQCGETVHLDFDNWAVWWAYRPEIDGDENSTAISGFFVIDIDTGFIDWGPCDTVEEAQQFLQSKVNDWEMDEALTEASKGDGSGYTRNGDYVIIYSKTKDGWFIKNTKTNEFVHGKFSTEPEAEEYVNSLQEKVTATEISEGIEIATIADYIVDHYDFDDIDDKYSCINSIRDSFRDEKTISKEELEQFIGSHNGKDKVTESVNSGITLDEGLFDDDFSDEEIASITGGDTKNDTPDGLETPSETEARLKAMNEDADVTDVATATLEGPEEGAAAGVASLINDAIQDELKTADEYNSIAITAKAEGHEDIAAVIDEINTEEHKHIGQLEKALEKVAPNAEAIEVGKVEGGQQLGEVNDDIVVKEGIQPNDLAANVEDAFIKDELDLFVADALRDGSATEETLLTIANDSSSIELDDMKKAINAYKESLDTNNSNSTLNNNSDKDVLEESNMTESWEKIYQSFKTIEKELNQDGEAVTAVIDKMYQDNKNDPDYQKAYDKWASGE